MKIGEVVRLKSGSPNMTIIGFIDLNTGIDYQKGVRTIENALINLNLNEEEPYIALTYFHKTSQKYSILKKECVQHSLYSISNDEQIAIFQEEILDEIANQFIIIEKKIKNENWNIAKSMAIIIYHVRDLIEIMGITCDGHNEEDINTKLIFPSLILEHPISTYYSNSLSFSVEPPYVDRWKYPDLFPDKAYFDFSLIYKKNKKITITDIEKHINKNISLIQRKYLLLEILRWFIDCAFIYLKSFDKKFVLKIGNLKTFLENITEESTSE